MRGRLKERQMNITVVTHNINIQQGRQIERQMDITWIYRSQKERQIDITQIYNEEGKKRQMDIT
jgi:hypothetical protein